MTAPARRALALALCAAPALLTLKFILDFGVPVPFSDEWTYIDTLREVSEHGLSLKTLFAFHNDHWIVIPRAIMLALDSLSGFDTRWEMLVSWAAVCGTLALLWRRFEGDLLSFAPIAFLLFSLRQLENWLWGWQLQIFLCSFFAVLAFALLPRFALSSLAALGATWSFSAGLAVWPVIILQLWLDPRTRRRAWVVAAIFLIVFSIYGALYRHPGGTPSPLAFLHAPGETVLFVLAAAGAPLGWYFALAAPAAAVIAAAGFVAWRGRAALSMGLSLSLFGLGAIALVTIGRAGFGLDQALASKYVTLSLYLPLGIWWMLCEARPSPPRLAALSALAAVFCMGVADADLTGYTLGRHTAAERIEASERLLTAEQQPDERLKGLFDQTANLRRQVPWLRAHRLSFFRYSGEE